MLIDAMSKTALEKASITKETYYLVHLGGKTYVSFKGFKYTSHTHCMSDVVEVKGL